MAGGVKGSEKEVLKHWLKSIKVIGKNWTFDHSALEIVDEECSEYRLGKK
jgi:hypothetical protein